VVGDYINIIKTASDFNFDFNHEYAYTWKLREALNLNLITYKLVIRKKLVNNQKSNRKVVIIVLL